MQTLPLFDQPLTKPKSAHEIASSSREVYKELKASGKLLGKQMKALQSLDDYGSFHSPPTPTIRELHAWMVEVGRCKGPVAEIQPRLSECEDEGLIERCDEAERRKCKVTGKKVFTWSLTERGRLALQGAK